MVEQNAMLSEIARLEALKKAQAHRDEQRALHAVVDDERRKLDRSLVDRIESSRKLCDTLAQSMGVKLTDDSLAVPIPIDLLQAIVEKLHSLEARIEPAVEFISLEDENAGS